MSIQQEVKDELDAIEAVYQTWLEVSQDLTAESKGRVVSWLVDKINSDHRAVNKIAGGVNGPH